MATPDEIASLRRATGITQTTDPYTDEQLGVLLDAMGHNQSAAQLWDEKAATFAAAVDTTESGSTRRMSQLHTQALTMAAKFRELDMVVTAPRRGTFTVGIERV